LHSRHTIYQGFYADNVAIEAGCAIHIAQTQILPVALDYQTSLADTVKSLKDAGVSDTASVSGLLEKVSSLTSELMRGIETVAAADEHDPLGTLDKMAALRATVDALEGLVPDDMWPLPSYAEMLFVY
jgi:glutamine synthetase